MSGKETQLVPIELLRTLQLRLLEQSWKHQTHHLSSSFSTLPILIEVYQKLGSMDRFILSNGHAAPALYVVLEHFLSQDSDAFFVNMGDHPKRQIENGIFCSTGSLGMGLTVAVGMALAKPNNFVHCVISDGECCEGSIWESLRFAKNKRIDNLAVYVNMNGWSAYDSIDTLELEKELKSVFPKIQIRESNSFPFEESGLDAHYFKLSEKQYLEARERICAKNL